MFLLIKLKKFENKNGLFEMWKFKTPKNKLGFYFCPGGKEFVLCVHKWQD